MSASKQISTLHNTVKELLEADPRLRDSDNKLWCRIVSNEIGNTKTKTAYELLCMIAMGELPNFESVSRARRSIQEDFPELRGVKYNERQKEQENVITELGYKLDLK